MKKRAKIITTIASLCLAVALMAFGVYAATTVTFSVTTKVSFEVADVFITIDASAYKSPDGTVANVTEFDAVAMDAYKSYTPGTPNVPNANVGGAEASQPSWTIANDAIKLDSVNKYIVYVVTISNDDGHAIKIKATATPGTFATANMTRGTYTAAVSPASQDNTENVVTGFAATETGTVVNVPVGTTVTFTYTAYVTNLAADVTNFEIDFTYEIVQNTAAFANS